MLDGKNGLKVKKVQRGVKNILLFFNAMVKIEKDMTLFFPMIHMLLEILQRTVHLQQVLVLAH